ncbi:MAG: AAA family ATPase [Halobacteriovoraceae bacterium]|nr:AAA family ATPase [Halobacteriovoraceae bacterium]MCB9094152.1 AAA family ATPase [Halobacteriovoraceae bacterium]
MVRIFTLCFLFTYSVLGFSQATFTDNYQKLRQDYSSYEKALHDNRDLFSNYQKVIRAWREIVDETFDFLPSRIMFQDAGEEKEHFNNYMELLLKYSELRSQYIRKITYKTDSSVFEISPEFLWDLKRELQLVPLKWVAIISLKINFILNNLSSGFKGIKTLVVDIFILIIVILIPLFLWRLSIRLLSGLRKLRSTFTRKSYVDENYYIYSELIKFSIEYLPWIVAILSLDMVIKLLQHSNFKELSIFIPYVEYYLYFRVFQKVFTQSLMRVSFFRQREEALKIKQKAENNGRKLSLIIFISISFLYAVESVVSQGLSYIIFENLFIFGITVFLFYLASDWKEDLAAKVEEMKIKYVSPFLSKILLQKRYFFLCLPVLLSLVVFNALSYIFQWSERFDFVKRITAQIFKKKLESSEFFTESELQALPENYTSYFDLSVDNDLSLLVDSERGYFTEMEHSVQQWLDDKTEDNSLVVVGEKGIGKTTLLWRLSQSFKDKCRVITAPVPSERLLNQKDMYGFVGKLFDIEMSESLLPLLKADKDMPKTLLLVDETQNTFLAKVGGFEGFKSLLEIINARLENIFFVFSFNTYSWSYLSSILANNQSFRKVLKLDPWTDRDIKNLIMQRHEKTDYGLSFLDILRATKGNFEMESLELVEDQFFRLLWEQSLGNPKVSLSMWLSSLKYGGGKIFRVGLPHDDEIKFLNELVDNTLFIYAAITRHENLSVKDIMEITDLPEGVVRYSIKLGMDNEILVKNQKSTFSVNTRFHHSIIGYLKKKNLVYA